MYCTTTSGGGIEKKFGAIFCPWAWAVCYSADRGCLTVTSRNTGEQPVYLLFWQKQTCVATLHTTTHGRGDTGDSSHPASRTHSIPRNRHCLPVSQRSGKRRPLLGDPGLNKVNRQQRKRISTFSLRFRRHFSLRIARLAAAQQNRPALHRLRPGGHSTEPAALSSQSGAKCGA